MYRGSPKSQTGLSVFFFLYPPPGHIRISDLGLAVRLTEENEVQGRVGTLGYMGMYISHKCSWFTHILILKFAHPSCQHFFFFFKKKSITRYISFHSVVTKSGSDCCQLPLKKTKKKQKNTRRRQTGTDCKSSCSYRD